MVAVFAVAFLNVQLFVVGAVIAQFVFLFVFVVE
jgi:hypothetical protein